VVVVVLQVNISSLVCGWILVLSCSVARTLIFTQKVLVSDFMTFLLDSYESSPL
jgi:hypothetical protein